jgi:hypothetical protein
MTKTITLTKIELALIQALIHECPVTYCKPMEFTAEEIVTAALALVDFFGQLNRKLLGPAQNIAPGRFQIRDRPNELDYLN